MSGHCIVHMKLIQYGMLWFSCSVTSNSLLIPWTAACQASLFFTTSWSLLKLMSIESMMPSNCLILCHPLLLPSIFPSIRVFYNELALCIRWPQYWSFSFSISPFNEYSGLISFRINCFHFLTVQGTLKSLLQYHNSKACDTGHLQNVSTGYHICLKECLEFSFPSKENLHKRNSIFS